MRGISGCVDVRSLCVTRRSTCRRCSHDTLCLTLFTRLKPVVVAFTAAVVERLTVTQ